MEDKVSFEVVENGGESGDGSYFCSVSCWESYVENMDGEGIDMQITDYATLKLLYEEKYKCDYCNSPLFQHEEDE